MSGSVLDQVADVLKGGKPHRDGDGYAGQLLGLRLEDEEEQQQRQKQAGTVPTEGAEPRINPFGGFHFDSPPLSEEKRGERVGK